MTDPFQWHSVEELIDGREEHLTWRRPRQWCPPEWLAESAKWYDPNAPIPTFNMPRNGGDFQTTPTGNFMIFADAPSTQPRKWWEPHGAWMVIWGDGYVIDPTHWMPYPDPPEPKPQ